MPLRLIRTGVLPPKKGKRQFQKHIVVTIKTGAHIMFLSKKHETILATFNVVINDYTNGT